MGHMGLGQETPETTLSVQFSSVTQSCECNPMDCLMPGFPVHHQLPDLAHTRVQGFPPGDLMDFSPSSGKPGASRMMTGCMLTFISAVFPSSCVVCIEGTPREYGTLECAVEMLFVSIGEWENTFFI